MGFAILAKSLIWQRYTPSKPTSRRTSPMVFGMLSFNFVTVLWLSDRCSIRISISLYQGRKLLYGITYIYQVLVSHHGFATAGGLVEHVPRAPQMFLRTHLHRLSRGYTLGRVDLLNSPP
jgi:hypothetical protein